MKQKFTYQLVSERGIIIYERYEDIPKEIIIGKEEDLSKDRGKGILCHRKELDNQPIIKGYLGPMYNGILEDGSVCIRYETEYINEIMSM